MGQNCGAGLTNSKATANCPSRDFLTPTTLQASLRPADGLSRKSLSPVVTLGPISSKPPWAFTTSVRLPDGPVAPAPFLFRQSLLPAAVFVRSSAGSPFPPAPSSGCARIADQFHPGHTR